MSSATTAIVSLSGALAVALIAAVAAELRQRTSLREERARLDRQLSEERTRLDRQLLHDRELRDRDELRVCLDDAVRTLRDAVVCTKGIVDAQKADAADPQFATPDWPALLSDLRDADGRALVMYDRIAIRLGVDSKAAKEYIRGRLACCELLRIVAANPQSLPATTQLRETALTSLRAYIAAAKELVGADVDNSGSNQTLD